MSTDMDRTNIPRLPYYTVQEVGEQLGLSGMAVTQMIHRREISAGWTPRGYFIHEDEIARLKARRALRYSEEVATMKAAEADQRDHIHTGALWGPLARKWTVDEKALYRRAFEEVVPTDRPKYLGYSSEERLRIRERFEHLLAEHYRSTGSAGAA